MNKLTAAILIAMLLGILVGHLVRSLAPDAAMITSFTANITILTDIFLRLIKMIIAPLVFTTLTVGIAKMGERLATHFEMSKETNEPPNPNTAAINNKPPIP